MVFTAVLSHKLIISFWNITPHASITRSAETSEHKAQYQGRKQLVYMNILEASVQSSIRINDLSLICAFAKTCVPSLSPTSGVHMNLDKPQLLFFYPIPIDY